MDPSANNGTQPCAGEGLRGIQRFWPLDDGAWGYGVAADIGTAKITCRLYALETDEMLGELSIANPQNVYGNTIEARLAAIENGKLEEMTEQIQDKLVEMFSILAKDAGIELSDVETIIICGNTVMECIANGFDPQILAESLGESEQLFGCSVDYLAANEQGIAAGEAYFVPCPSVEVGGDIICGLLAIDILSSESPVLFVDFGAYTQLALGDKGGIALCALYNGKTVEQAIEALLDARGISAEQVESIFVSEGGASDIPAALQERVRCVGNAAIEGASAVLLSDRAEDELCSIAEACTCIEF